MTPRLLATNGVWLSDTWSVEREAGAAPAGLAVLLPLETWLTAAPSPSRSVWLAPHDQLDALAGRLDGLALIGIDFPKFTDGRGYTLAHGLRTRLGYTGELRAIGDVLIDQLSLLRRVGFSQFALRADQDPEAALAALSRYSDAYQGSVDQPLPAFRRGSRAATGVAA